MFMVLIFFLHGGFFVKIESRTMVVGIEREIYV